MFVRFINVLIPVLRNFPPIRPIFIQPTKKNVKLNPPREKIMVFGGGPNRIGQGIEFDYCCVHAALAIARRGL